MLKLNRIKLLFLTLLVVALGVLSPRANAQHTDAVYNGYISAYQVPDGSNFYIAKSLTNRADGFWGEGYDIFNLEDAYFQTRKASRYTQIVQLMNDFLARNGNDWTGDSWDDDLEWIVYGFIRGYQITGNTAYLTAASNNWNAVYNRGWDSTFGGGIWENIADHNSKCALSNLPFAMEGIELYRSTGDSNYLTKSEAAYAWIRSHLYNPTNSNNSLGAPGQVSECVHSSGPSVSDNAYNQGLMIEAAAALYRATGTASYLADAKLTATHSINKWPIMNVNNTGNSQADNLYRGLGQLSNQNDLWSSYQTYLQNNANAAWNVRRTDFNISHNNFTTQTSTTADLTAQEAGDSLVVQAVLPISQSFSGNYEIQNVNSGLALDVSGGSTSSGAAVVQNTYTGSTSQLWTLVATTGGYYQIKNVKSGLVLNVKGHSTTSGALVQQYGAQGPTPGNDRWLPAFNTADSTWSFYNLNSTMALDIPGASKSTGVQLDQWFTSNNSNQKFNLIAR